jgi:DNA-binding NarL/FixJ family response regulator
VTIRLLAVDPHMLLRLGLRQVVAGCPDIELVGEAPTGAEALRLALAHRPDVITIGLLLPDEDGILTATRLRRQLPDLGVVLFTAVDEEAVLLRAADAGLSAYLVKTAAAEAVVAAIRHAAWAPHAFTSPGLAAALRGGPTAGGLLSRREQQVLGLLRDGCSLPAIATRLGVGEATVKTYVSRIYGKLRVNNRTQAVMVALGRGLLRTEPAA